MGNKLMKQVGVWAFGIGLTLAVILALLSEFTEVVVAGAWIGITLVLLGFAIGAINVSRKESVGFLVSVLVVGASTGIVALLPIVGGFLETILQNITAIILPAGLVVGLAKILTTTKD